MLLPVVSLPYLFKWQPIVRTNLASSLLFFLEYCICYLLFPRQLTFLFEQSQNMCYLGIYNRASWRLPINVTPECIYGRCNLAYLVPLKDIHMIRNITRSRLRKWSKTAWRLLLWRPSFKSITRLAIAASIALICPLNCKHFIFLFETCHWHIARWKSRHRFSYGSILWIRHA